MKTTISIFLTIVIFSIQSYCNDTLREVNIEQIWMQEQWVNYTRITTLYIKQRLPIKSHWEIWDKDHYINYSLMFYKYNDDDRIIEQLIMNDIDNQWQNARLTQYEYTDAGKIKKTLLSFWEENEWAPNQEIEYIYDESNFLIKVNRYTWKDKVKNHIFIDSIINNQLGLPIEKISKMNEDGQWVFEFRFLNEYQNGKLISEIQQYWQNDTWENIAKIEYKYTGTGKNDEVTYYRWSNQQWIYNNKYVYEYYTDDKLWIITEYVWITDNWAPKRKEEWIYAEDGRVKEYYIYVWFNDQWGNYERNLYDYYTGINVENILVNGFNFYPNPAANYINIDKITSSKAILVKIIGLDGKIFKNFSLYPNDNAPIRIDISDLPDGIYQIILNNSDFQLQRSFIKSR